MNKKYAEYFRWKRINTLKNGDIIFWLILLKKPSYLYLFHVIITIFFQLFVLFICGCMVPCYKTRYCPLEIGSLVAHPSHLNSISFATLQLGWNVCYTWVL